MSDTGRQGLGDKVSSSITPDSQKSTLDQAKDSVSGTADKVAGSVQPESEKSTTQKASDSLVGGKDDAQNQGSGVMQSAQDTLNSVSNSVSNALGGNQK